MSPEQPSSSLKNSKKAKLPPLAQSAANSQHQVEAALADDPGNAQHARQQARAAHGPPSLPLRLLTKPEVRRIAGGVSYVTLWSWMRAGRFPRSRVVGGKSMWLSSEIDAWLADLPVRALKGDPEVEVA
jgi:predicted DNA-binding transcriptional regulator AlpA